MGAWLSMGIFPSDWKRFELLPLSFMGFLTMIRGIMQRTAQLERKTRETTISGTLTLDGRGKKDVSTGIGFFDHMLDHLSKHSGISLNLHAQGDLEVDYHHTVEDCGIVLGELLLKAIGNGAGINRFGSASVPMEETLAEVSLDLCGRGYLVFNVPVLQPKVGDFDSELVREFFLAFTRSGRFTAHIRVTTGKNQHHIFEAIFKAFARALREAVMLTGSEEIPSTKGVL